MIGKKEMGEFSEIQCILFSTILHFPAARISKILGFGETRSQDARCWKRVDIGSGAGQEPTAS